MGKAALRNLLAHKGRLALSLLAVVLSAGFVSGTLIFTDTLQSSFNQLFAQTTSDVVVSPPDTDAPTSESGDGTSAPIPTLPASTVAAVESTDGIAAAAGDVFVQGATVIGADGKPVGSGGAPGFGVNWISDPTLSTLTLVEGDAPTAPGQAAIDTETADKGALSVGDETTVVTPAGIQQVTIVGLFRFGVSGSLNGATLTAFTTSVAQQFMLDGLPRYTSVSATADEGVSQRQAADNVKAALGSGPKVQTGAEAADEAASDLADALGFFNTILLGFAFVSVVVGLFLIFNTFAMIVAQRSRELALFRAIGASRGQVRRSVLTEAVVVGAVGALLGVLGGLAIAAGLRALFGLVGLDFTGSLVLSPRTVVVALVVGLGATLLASWLPARRAARVPPVAALRDDHVASPRSLRWRSMAGAAMTVLAALALLVAVTADPIPTKSSFVGVSFLLAILSVIVLAPVMVGPAVRVLGAPFRGTVGRIAVANALRNRRRTALTAAALMIGLALVGAFSTLAVSFADSTDAAVDDAITADFIVSTTSFTPMPAEVGESLAAVDGMATVSRVRFAPVRSFGQDGTVVGVDADTYEDVTNFTFTAGDGGLAALDGLVIDSSIAQAQALVVGDTVQLTFASGQKQAHTVTGIYQPQGLFNGLIVSNEALAEVGTPPLDSVVYAKLADGVDPGTVRPAVDAAVADNPTVQVQDLTEFKDGIRKQINGLLIGIYALLALALVIAVLGIINTLALSVVERTREIGLLRAVGSSRRQLRRMIRIESLVTSVFGAIVGLLVGVFFGQMFVRVLKDAGLAVASTPWISLGVFLIVAALVGILAAAWPAWRASRMDVLQAIATE